MSFEKFKQMDARLTVLRFLAEQNDWSLNEFAIQTALAQMAHTFSRDQVRTELTWLAEQSLISVRENSGVMVARLTNRGEEASRGIITVPGVQRPTPGDV